MNLIKIFLGFGKRAAVAVGKLPVRNSFGIGLSLLVAALVMCPAVFAASLQEADEAYQQGRYRNAITLYLGVKSAADATAATLGASRSYAATGEYTAAEQVCRDALGKSTQKNRINTQLAEVLFTVGRTDEAMTILEKVVKQPNAPLRALVKYGEYLRYRGRWQDAEAFFAAALATFNGQINLQSEDAGLAARAEWLMGNYQGANRLFREAVRLDPRNAEAQVWWGDLFSEKYNKAEALQSYQTVLSFNPYHIGALVGVAITANERKLLEKALYTNPLSADAFAAYAELAMKQNKFSEASSYLTAALPNNPQSLSVLTMLAAIAKIQDRDAEYRDYEKQVLAIQPNSGEFYSKVADYFSNDYRFTEAVSFARKAVAVQPNYWPAYTALGMNLIRLGEETEGRQQLELAFDKDPYNIWTSNMLKVFDTLDTYVDMKSQNFLVRMSVKDSKVLWPYLEPLLEDAWTTLVDKYGFTPEGPILVEVFEKREDFAVRSVGLPDIGPLVGICFGKVITLISPDTLSANWQEIVWHEFAHIITLQMTNNRIPRWLSEGISVYEEFQGREEWGRRQDMDVVRGVNNGKFLPVETMDDAFMLAESDDDLNLAYLQSYLVVEYIAKQHGFNKLKQLIKAYDSANTTEQNIEKVFAQSNKDFNVGFSKWLEAEIAAVNVYVDEDDMADEGAGHGHGVRNNSSAMMAEQYSIDSLKRYMQERIEREPRDFHAYLQLGIVLFKEKDYEKAEEYLLKAKAILPYYTSYPSPPLVLSQIYEAQGNSEKHIKELEYLVRFHQHDADAPLALARYAMKSNDYAKADYYLQRAIAVDPYRLDVHRDYAQLSDMQRNYAASIREYEILVQLDKTDPVSSYTQLAEAYLNGGKPQQAKQTSLRALEIAPTYTQAQHILLKAIGE